jgi:hypothetical protein
VTKLTQANVSCLSKLASAGQRYFFTFWWPRYKFLPQRSRYNNQPKIIAARRTHSPIGVGAHAESASENAKPASASSPQRRPRKLFSENYGNQQNPHPIGKPV